MKKIVLFLFLLAIISGAGDLSPRYYNGRDLAARESYWGSAQTVNCDSVALDSIRPFNSYIGERCTLFGWWCLAPGDEDSFSVVVDGTPVPADEIIDSNRIAITVPYTDTGIVDTIILELDTGLTSLYDTLINGLYISPPDSSTINMTENIIAGGTYVLDPVSVNNKYEAGTSVIITATAAEHYSWVSNDTMTENPYTVVVGNADTTVLISWGLIDSIRPDPQYVNQYADTIMEIDIYGAEMGAGSKILIGATETGPLSLSIYDHLTDTIPAAINRGMYQVKVINANGDTLTCSDSLRLCKMRIK